MADETRLLQQLREGEEGALEAAIRLYTPYLSTVLYRAFGGGLSREDTEEVIADAFVSLWRNAGRLDPQKGTLRAWLAGTAKKLGLKRLHTAGRPVSLEELTPSEEPCTGPPDGGLWQLVMGLGEPDAEIFVRFYRYGESLREIAGALDMKLSTVKTRLSRGKKKLKQQLEEAEETP